MTSRGEIFQRTGVLPPSVDPGSLESLAGIWESVRSAAVTVQGDVGAAVTHVLDNNQDAAVDAFAATTQGDESASMQLTRLADAASATRDAHQAAAQAINSAVTSMNATATSRAWDVFFARIRFDSTAEDEIISRATGELQTLLDAATIEVDTAYDTLDLPEIIDLQTSDLRGALPPEIADIWAGMTTQQRIDVLEAIADDVMSDWPEDERPEIIFYSTSGNPLGVDDWPGKGQQGSPEEEEENRQNWGGANGGASGTEQVWINVDNLDSEQLIHTMPHELQHTQQALMRDQYDEMNPLERWAIRRGLADDPFVSRGSNIHEVERSKELPYRNDDYYYYQLHEVDARRGGAEYVDDLTIEKWVDLGGPPPEE